MSDPTSGYLCQVLGCLHDIAVAVDNIDGRTERIIKLLGETAEGVDVEPDPQDFQDEGQYREALREYHAGEDDDLTLPSC